jgi:hypothetical protein
MYIYINDVLKILEHLLAEVFHDSLNFPNTCMAATGVSPKCFGRLKSVGIPLDTMGFL